MSKRVEYNPQLEQLLHSAVAKNQIELVYQPQMDLDGQIIGVEVLARWLSDMVETILSLARIFNFNIVAEGLEEKAQLEFLHKHGCSIF
jgi:EAL domain-containing protein (putative c-di-GMP-specific phosphodiesterase class I)